MKISMVPNIQVRYFQLMMCLDLFPKTSGRILQQYECRMDEYSGIQFLEHMKSTILGPYLPHQKHQFWNRFHRIAQKTLVIGLLKVKLTVSRTFLINELMKVLRRNQIYYMQSVSIRLKKIAKYSEAYSTSCSSTRRPPIYTGPNQNQVNISKNVFKSFNFLTRWVK